MNTTPAWRSFGTSGFRAFRLFLGLFALASTAAVHATSVIPPDFNKLVSQADYIVRAVVTSVDSEMSTDGGRKHIVTMVTVDVRQVISGTPPQPLVLKMLGGKVGNLEMTVEGAPKFKVGDEDILFVHGNGQQMTPLVAMMHGRYPILRDSATGRQYVARSNGVPLYNEQDVSASMEADAASQAARAPGAQPLSPDDFVGRIHNAVNQNSRAKLEN